jgi:hypothetical protein
MEVDGKDVAKRGVEFRFRYDAWCAWLLIALGLGPRFSGVRVRDDMIDVRMGWGFHARIPRDRITGVTDAGRPFIGWGVHGWRGQWLVNGSMRDVVAVEIDPPVRARVCFVPVRLRTLWLSLADQAAFRATVARR